MERDKYLSSLSGLNVVIRKEKNRNFYAFVCGDHDVTGFWTYPKAKAFAEGVDYGRRTIVNKT